jgi:hypothetical protein
VDSTGELSDTSEGVDSAPVGEVDALSVGGVSGVAVLSEGVVDGSGSDVEGAGSLGVGSVLLS